MLCQSFFPVVVNVPTVSILGDSVRVPLEATRIVQPPQLLGITGYLRALVSGTFSVDIVRLSGGATIATLSWTAAGIQRSPNFDPAVIFNTPDDGFRVDVGSIGVGAANCTLVFWLTGCL